MYSKIRGTLLGRNGGVYMQIKANAKINLALDVLGKRDDGYHEVSMIMQEVSLCDIVDIEITDVPSINLKVKNSPLPCNENNIAYRAASAFYQKAGIEPSCTIQLEKHIPVCAGLGGGSSDAAAVLKGLNNLYGNLFTDDELCNLALSLGADVPFFIKGKTAHASGIGERLVHIPSDFNLWAVLIKPDIDISTAEAYRQIDSASFPNLDMSRLIRGAKEGDISVFANSSGNSFEYVCTNKYPEINNIKNHLKGCGALFAMMSGSGPTVFGVFDSEDTAQKAFQSYEGSFQGGGVCRFVV